MDKLWTGSSIVGKMDDMSGSRTTDQCFLAWCLAQCTR